MTCTNLRWLNIYRLLSEVHKSTLKKVVFFSNCSSRDSFFLFYQLYFKPLSKIQTLMPDVTQLICTTGINMFRKCLLTEKVLHCQRAQVQAMFSFSLRLPRGKIMKRGVQWGRFFCCSAFLHIVHNICDKNISGPCSFWPTTSFHHTSECSGLVVPKSPLVTLWPWSPPGD